MARYMYTYDFSFRKIFFDSISELFLDFRLPCSIFMAFCKHECDLLKLNDIKKGFVVCQLKLLQ